MNEVAGNPQRRGEDVRQVRLGFGGDFCLAAAVHRGIEYVHDVESFARSLTAGADWSMANLEFCIRPDDLDQRAKMGVPQSYCTHLHRTGFNAFCVANNHVLDDGEGTLLNTLRTLSCQGIDAVGAGASVDQAQATLSVDIAGVSLAVLAATDATHYAAGRETPGVATLQHRRLIGQVHEAASSHDLVVVNLHSDLEFTNLPAPWRVRLSRALVRAGAHIVVHHHPHTLQGIEYYGGGLIAYSLGNLVFPLRHTGYMADRPGRVDHGAFLYVDVKVQRRDAPTISHSLEPVVLVDADRSELADARTAGIIRQAVADYSHDLVDARLLRQAHFARCKAETLHYLKGLYYAGAGKGPRALWLAALHPLRTRMARQGLVGFASGGLL